MSAFIDMSAATGNAECQLSLTKIIVDTLGGAMRNVLRTCAEKINDRFDELSTLDSDDRLDAIITMFGLNEEDIVKIKMPVKKNADPTKKNATKPKAEKKIPVPFWGQKTVKPELCQGLMAGLYNQCTGKPKAGCIYCTKCQKEADSNGGIPKRGNIALRLEQFEESFYEYTPPGGKVKKIYYYQHVLKHNFTDDDIDEMLKANGIKLNNKGKLNLLYVPEKKTRKPKEENLTDDMEKPKISKKKKVPEPEPEPENDDEDEDEDFDDTGSVCSQSTIATDQTGLTEQTEQTDFDDDDIPYPPDDDEDDKPEPVKKPQLVFKKGDKVVYKHNGDIKKVTIVGVHLDDDTPYYTIKLKNGNEKTTDGNNLSLDSEPEPAKKKVTIPDNVSSISMKVDFEGPPKPKKSALKKKDPEPEPEPEPEDEEEEEEIDITNYKIANFGEERYAMLKDADLNQDVDLYSIKDYVGPKKFKIVNLQPVGKFNNNKKKVKIF